MRWDTTVLHQIREPVAHFFRVPRRHSHRRFLLVGFGVRRMDASVAIAEIFGCRTIVSARGVVLFSGS